MMGFLSLRRASFLVTLVGTNKTINAFVLRGRHPPMPFGKARIKSLVKWPLFSSSPSSSTFNSENNDLVEDLQEFNPLRPPSYLASLRIGESYNIPILGDAVKALCITRLSRNPDIFLVPSFIGQTERLIDAANRQGLNVAGTRKSQSNTIRTHSYLTWLGDTSDVDDAKDGALQDNHESSRCFLHSIRDICNSLFVHESLQIQRDLNPEAGRHHHHQHPQKLLQSMHVTAEDMQIAKYDSGGCFHLHHDGFNRFLTVLTYLNGVGGTYFPLAQTKERDNNHHEHELLNPPKLSVNNDGSLSSQGYVVGEDGLLIVGKEGESAYLDDSRGNDEAGIVEGSSAFARIHAGDAVVFYNYNRLMEDASMTNVDGRDDPEQTGDGGSGKEWRAVHAALPAPQEKWIATNWFRSDVLTGPFAHLYRESLLSGADPD
jgi:hypothetical protein